MGVQEAYCVGTPSVNLGSPIISETTTSRKLKLKTIRCDKVLALGIIIFFHKGRPRRPGSAGPPNVNLGLPKIYEITRARKLKLKMPLNIVKHSRQVQLFFSARGRTGGTGALT